MFDKKILRELQEYIDIHMRKDTNEYCKYLIPSNEILYDEVEKEQIKDFIKGKRKLKFNEILFDFIDKKGKIDSEVYKKAGVDGRHFSKIPSNPDCCIGKTQPLPLHWLLN